MAKSEGIQLDSIVACQIEGGLAIDCEWDDIESYIVSIYNPDLLS